MKWSDTAEVRRAFETEYGRIYEERFAGLPIVNPVLSVRVVGVRETDDFLTFSLLTPWMLNQIAVPKRAEAAPRLARLMRQDRLDRLGDFYVKNVLSPMSRFRSMEVAVRRAESEAERLYRSLSREVAEDQQERVNGDSPAQPSGAK
jgi:hypothetical protein